MNQALRAQRHASFPVLDHLLGSLTQAQHNQAPFDYWLLEDCLPQDVMQGIVDLPFAPPAEAVFEGHREDNNSTRVHFTPDKQKKFGICADVATAFNHPRLIGQLEEMTGADLSKGSLRIEYCQDTDGFWLEPHVDISVKLLTMLVYLSDDPLLSDAGTDIYDESPEHRLVARSPYGRGKGLIFVPCAKSWHGYSKRPIRGIRRSIMINFVAPQWRAREELCFPEAFTGAYSEGDTQSGLY